MVRESPEGLFFCLWSRNNDLIQTLSTTHRLACRLTGESSGTVAGASSRGSGWHTPNTNIHKYNIVIHLQHCCRTNSKKKKKKKGKKWKRQLCRGSGRTLLSHRWSIHRKTLTNNILQQRGPRGVWESAGRVAWRGEGRDWGHVWPSAPSRLPLEGHLKR